MAKPELGQKQLCPNDQTKFYDLGRRPAVCPKCGFAFDPEEVVKSRRVRSRTPDYEEAEEKDATLTTAEAGEDHEEEDESERTPEIDEAADDVPVVTDDDADEAPEGTPADGVGIDFAEEDVEEDAADVPFLEDEEEDEDFPEDEIDGLPGEEDPER